MNTIKLVISGGNVRYIHTPQTAEIVRAAGPPGPPRRASDVNVTPDLSLAAQEVLARDGRIPADADARFLWWAELRVAPVVLGPFPSHAAAVEAEQRWLIAHGIPVCSPVAVAGDVDAAAQQLLMAIPPVAGECRAVCRCRGCGQLFGRRYIPYGLGYGATYRPCPCIVSNSQGGRFDTLVELAD